MQWKLDDVFPAGIFTAPPMAPRALPMACMSLMPRCVLMTAVRILAFGSGAKPS